MRKLFNLDHPAFRPLWVRLLITAVALGWACVEFVVGSPGWAVIFLGMGVWAIWALLVTYVPPE